MPPLEPEIDRANAIAAQLDWPAPDRVVNALGLLCPEPLLATREAIDELQPGQHVLVAATDPHAALDLEVYCRRFGHQLLDRHTAAEVEYFLLRLAAQENED